MIDNNNNNNNNNNNISNNNNNNTKPQPQQNNGWNNFLNNLQPPQQQQNINPWFNPQQTYPLVNPSIYQQIQQPFAANTTNLTPAQLKQIQQILLNPSQTQQQNTVPIWTVNQQNQRDSALHQKVESLQQSIIQILNQQNQTKIKTNTPYGCVDSSRQPVINHYKQNGGDEFKAKLELLNDLLNKTNKNDEFVKTCLAGKIYNLCMLCIYNSTHLVFKYVF